LLALANRFRKTPVLYVQLANEPNKRLVLIALERYVLNLFRADECPS
jgi:hypothetical protein